jgi:hypothetical protein
VVDGILHTLSAFVHDVDTFGGQVADLETVVTLGDGYVDLVGTHGGSVVLRYGKGVVDEQRAGRTLVWSNVFRLEARRLLVPAYAHRGDRAGKHRSREKDKNRRLAEVL